MLPSVDELLLFYYFYKISVQKVVPGVPIKRNDDTATGDFILNMTHKQRKELGINKSTLRYIQKNLREGKKVKLYDKVEAKISSGK